MKHRRFVFFLFASVIFVMLLLIYWDQQENLRHIHANNAMEDQGSREPLFDPSIVSQKDTRAWTDAIKASSDSLADSGLSFAEDGLQQQRISYLKEVLDTLAHQRARLPYYGELILAYSRAGLFRSAAQWAEKRSMVTGMAKDWKEAGDLYFESVRRGRDEKEIKDDAQKAEAMYLRALKNRPHDPDILTDLAVVYMSLLDTEKSSEMLQQALRSQPDHMRAQFNMAVLLHQTGRASESIPYFERLQIQAAGSEWEEVIRGYLQNHHDEIFH